MDLKKPKQRPPIVHYPISLEHEKFIGTVYGFYHRDSNEYNITNYGQDDGSRLPIGVIVRDGDELGSSQAEGLIGRWLGGSKLEFRQGERPCKKQPYELVQNVFSRNAGILETSVMLGKKAVICGCGSVGSLIALELARAGVGHFLLIDQDTLAYHNLCRHQCGIADVGRFKVDAVRERIHQINPAAVVQTQPTILEQVPLSVFQGFCDAETVLIGCADNREADLRANEISYLFGAPFIALGLWERAAVGEVFYAIPGTTPCYQCLFGRRSSSVPMSHASANRRLYTNEEDLTSTRFEPGISTDISFVTHVGIKLILDILNRSTAGYMPRLLQHLTQFTLVCNSNHPQVGGEAVEIFAYPLQVTTSLVVDYDENCGICRQHRTPPAVEICDDR